MCLERVLNAHSLININIINIIFFLKRCESFIIQTCTVLDLPTQFSLSNAKHKKYFPLLLQFRKN